MFYDIKNKLESMDRTSILSNCLYYILCAIWVLSLPAAMSLIGVSIMALALSPIAISGYGVYMLFSNSYDICGWVTVYVFIIPVLLLSHWLFEISCDFVGERFL